MILKEVVNRVADWSGVKKKDIRAVLRAYHDLIRGEIFGGRKYTISGLGFFYTKDAMCRKCVDLRGVDNVEYEQKKIIKFKPARSLSKTLNDEKHKNVQ